MDSHSTANTAPSTLSTPSDRDSSPELGSPSHLPQYNKKTGRPIRQSAGKMKAIAGYVSSAVIDEGDEDEDDEPIELLSEDDDDKIVRPKRKRRQSPSPAPLLLDPIIYDQEVDEASDEDSAAMFHNSSLKSPITLQFNVPLGYHGPLVVKLDRSLLENNTEGTIHGMQPRRVRRKLAVPELEPQETVFQIRGKGFADLPAELRNKVYRHLFVSNQDISVPSARDLSRSGQFLSTCKLVHSEGCSVLYSENAFSFDRNRTTRGPFWEPKPKEIGYKDALQFLRVIGPENLVYLRDIKFIFEDANPASTPYLDSHEDRRYLNDVYLIECLRVLRQAKLRQLTLSFLGRRTLLPTDVKFLGYLEQIKADEVTCANHVRWYYASKITHSLWNRLKDTMTRKRKLYVKEKI